MMRWALQIICKHNLKFLVMFPRALLRTPYKRIMSSSKPSSNQATSTFQPIRILLLLSDNQWVIFAPSFSDQSGFFKNWATNECSSPSPRERENVPPRERKRTGVLDIWQRGHLARADIWPKWTFGVSHKESIHRVMVNKEPCQQLIWSKSLLWLSVQLYFKRTCDISRVGPEIWKRFFSIVFTGWLIILDRTAHISQSGFNSRHND